MLPAASPLSSTSSASRDTNFLLGFFDAASSVFASCLPTAHTLFTCHDKMQDDMMIYITYHADSRRIIFARILDAISLAQPVDFHSRGL